MEQPMNYNKRKEVISQVSRADGFSQDSYFGLSNSYQYSENINSDDEMHGIKLAQKIVKSSNNQLKACQLITVNDKVYAFPFTNGGKVVSFDKNSDLDSTLTAVSGVTIPTPSTISGRDVSCGEATYFQNKLRISVYMGKTLQNVAGFFAISPAGNDGEAYIPYDHNTFSDEDISTPDDTKPMQNSINCVLNFNNSRLIVAGGNELRVYYPELDKHISGKSGQTGRKKVQTFWGGENIIALTCTFEYLKVRVQDAGFASTKVFYYQANNDFRSTFVYNQVNLTGIKVMRVYSINGIDYYTESLDGTDGFVSLNKLMGSTPVQIFTRRGGLVSEDIFNKSAAGYFIGPTSLDAYYINGFIYMADAHGVFKFRYNPSGKDSGYLKWKCRAAPKKVYGLTVCQNYLYVSYEDGICKMRLYDTGQDGYEGYSNATAGILISREFEGNSYQGCFTKMLDEVRVDYEMNPLLSNSANGTIEVFVSPNNTWTDTNPSGDGSDGWYKVMHIDGSMKNTRTQTTHLLNEFSNQKGETGFELDRQTITYLVKIKQGSNTKATPIVREIQLWYHTKGKANELYDIK